jgi:4,5-DOPA dioxygenase extradiol
MNLILDNEYTQSLQRLTSELPRPKAVCVVSAHWQTAGTRVCCAPTPRQIYDFYGFPDALYRIRYQPEGDPGVAQRAVDLLGGEREGVECDATWGHDHAGWAVLKHLYPRADVPVFLVSVDMEAPATRHTELAARLAPLREEGVLILGSGNIVHNLFVADLGNIEAPPDPRGLRFDAAVTSALRDLDVEALVHYERWGEDARYSVPTRDHYLPLLWVAALGRSTDAISFPCQAFQNGAVSMRSVLYRED